MQIRKAMLFAAGLGTRLRPLTNRLPKPLVPVLGTSILERHLASLQALGITEAVINLHHLGSTIREALGSGERWGMRLHFSEETPEILGTGGGLSAARKHFEDEEAFFVLNGDIFHDIPLGGLLKTLEVPREPAPRLAASQASASSKFPAKPVSLAAALLLRPHSGDPKEGWIGADGEGLIRRVPEMPEDPTLALQRFSFLGFHVLTPAIFPFLPLSGSFCILRVGYRGMLEKGLSIGSFVDRESLWMDIGAPASYLEANFRALEKEVRTFDPPERPGVRCVPPVWLAPDATVEEGCELGPYVILGRKARIGQGSRLEKTVVWDEAMLPPQTTASGAIFWEGTRLDVPSSSLPKGQAKD